MIRIWLDGLKRIKYKYMNFDGKIGGKFIIK